MAAAEIQDREIGLVSGQFSWSQSHQIFHETHENEAKTFSCKNCVCIQNKQKCLFDFMSECVLHLDQPKHQKFYFAKIATFDVLYFVSMDPKSKGISLSINKSF